MVVQYYAIWHTKLQNGTSDPHDMVDMTAYMKESLNARELEDYLHGRGGASLRALRHMCDLDNDDTESFDAKNGADIAVQYLNKYGPGLVSSFSVYNGFTDTTNRHHHGKPKKMPKGVPLHAIVLVDARKDADGKTFLLLQNWWPKKQYVEVDDEYFRACGAQLSFITKPLLAVPESFPTRAGHFMETEALDYPEHMMMEG